MYWQYILLNPGKGTRFESPSGGKRWNVMQMEFISKYLPVEYWSEPLNLKCGQTDKGGLWDSTDK